MFGLDISQAAVSRYMAMLRRKFGESWKTFLRDHWEHLGLEWTVEIDGELLVDAAL